MFPHFLDLMRNAGFVMNTVESKTCPKRAFRTLHPSKKTIRDISQGCSDVFVFFVCYDL